MAMGMKAMILIDICLKNDSSLGSSHSGAGGVECNWQVGLKLRKITIRGKYGDLVPLRYGADEKVGV